MMRVRESFGAKLLAGLLGTVGLLLAVTSVVVRSQTERQVDAVTERAVLSAETQSVNLEELQRRLTERLARPLVESPRALARLEAAIADGDLAYIAPEMAYEIDLAGLAGVFVVFTDADGQVVLTLRGEGGYDAEDPVDVSPLAVALLEGVDFEARAYRVMERRLYSVWVRVIEQAGRAIGTVSFGIPVVDQDVAKIGSVVGVEICLVAGGECVAGTPMARERLAAVLSQTAGVTAPVRVRAEETDWSIRARPLVAGDPDQGWRVVAVPLTEVLAPFARITRALFLGGGGALLLSVLMGSVLSRRLTRPVKELVAATDRVAHGDYEAQVAVTSRDEIGTLARAFNEMTRGLLLKERYRSVLDKVVSRDVAEELMKGEVELGGENRKVTVIFADVRGFSALTEGMEPQEVIGLLNECMERLSSAVDREGGVVDKYVGDELMAVFGAPVSQGDDAARALRAAVRMREAVEELNRERRARGDAPIGLGVGVSTGVVVAGNMGSKSRLNYTVLGDIVNLGSRLCSSARAGEILVSAATLSEAGDGVRAESLGTRAFKGFSSEVEVFAVRGLAYDSGPTAGRRGATGALSALLFGVVSLAAPGSLAAQGGWPTLGDLGVGYVSSSGVVQLDLSGQLDLETLAFTGHNAGLAYGSGVVPAPRLRLFTDVFVGDHLYGLVELRVHRGEAPSDTLWEARVEQAFIRVLNRAGTLFLQVGRFASPFGSYPQRHLTDIDPFVRPPLPYDQRTVISRTLAPPTADAFLGWKDQGDRFRLRGAPPVWGVPYQWGVMVAGSHGRWAYRVAAMNSAPSSEVEAWGWDGRRFEHPSWVAGLRAAVTAELSLGMSYDRGPYAEKELVSRLPGADHTDYVQEIVSLDASLARGPWMVRAEAFHDRWEVPNVVDDPVERAYSLEVQRDLATGVFVAARAAYIDFRPVSDGLGAASPRSGGRSDWDHDVARYAASVGYRITRNAGSLASFSHTRTLVGADPDDDLFAVRLWWAF